MKLTALNRLPEARVKFYAAEIILALDHLHQLGIMYRCVTLCGTVIATDFFNYTQQFLISFVYEMIYDMLLFSCAL
jgi:serine/threonine protein kinase